MSHTRASIGDYTNASKDSEGDLYVCPSARGNCIYEEAGSSQSANYDGRDLVCTYGANGYMVWSRGQNYTPGKLYSSTGNGLTYHDYQKSGDYKHDNYFGATKLSGIFNPGKTAYFMDHEYSVVVEWVMDPRTKNPLAARPPMTMPMGTRWHSIKSGGVYGYGNIAWVDGSVSKEPQDFADVDDDKNYIWTEYFAGSRWLRSPHD
jgi:prepilin-type processing-associated H-X9-DG protein